jgi:hypothetical protein
MLSYKFKDDFWLLGKFWILRHSCMAFRSLKYTYVGKKCIKGKPMRIWTKTLIFPYKCNLRTGTPHKFADLRLRNEPRICEKCHICSKQCRMWATSTSSRLIYLDQVSVIVPIRIFAPSTFLYLWTGIMHYGAYYMDGCIHIHTICEKFDTPCRFTSTEADISPNRFTVLLTVTSPPPPPTTAPAVIRGSCPGPKYEWFSSYKRSADVSRPVYDRDKVLHPYPTTNSTVNQPYIVYILQPHSRQSAFSPVVGIGTTPTPPRRRVCPPFGSGGRGTLAGERGGGRVPDTTRGNTLWWKNFLFSKTFDFPPLLLVNIYRSTLCLFQPPNNVLSLVHFINYSHQDSSK